MTADKEAKDPEYLSTLERGLSVLRAFDQHHPEMQLSEVALATGLNPAVARRCLNTLVKLRYVAQHGRRVLLGPEGLLFSSGYLSSMNIEQIVLPSLQALRDETGDSASMAILSGADILYVAHVSTSRRIRLGANVGTRYPWYATSLGKVLVAFRSDDRQNMLLRAAPFPALTEHTVSTGADMTSRLSLVRTRGYDSAQDELDYGIVSVALPLFGPNGKSLAAINCSTSTTRISQDELIRTRLPLLRQAAQEIEASLKRWPALSRSLGED